MASWNQAAYEILDAAFAIVGALGLPLAMEANPLWRSVIDLRMPSMTLVLVFYLAALCALYAVATYWGFLRREADTGIAAQPLADS